MKICFIGFGNMAQAIARGLVDQTDLEIHACSPSQREGKNHWGIYTHPENNHGVKEADVIILAVKPPQIIKVLQTLEIHPQALIISIAVAIPLSQINLALPDNAAAIRAMPNTPIAIKKGATPLVANSHCKTTHREAAERIFALSGIVSWMDEWQLEALSYVSGSGPAYLFLFIEAFTEAAVDLGLDESISIQFIKQTFEGALGLLNYSGESAAALRQKVTSPGGTTAAALAVFEDNNFKGIVANALKAAHNRAIQLCEEIK